MTKKLERQKKLEAKGWKVGTVQDFLELSDEETLLIEIKLALSRELRKRREAQMTQRDLAQRIGSSQPRIALVESGDSVPSPPISSFAPSSPQTPPHATSAVSSAAYGYQQRELPENEAATRRIDRDCRIFRMEEISREWTPMMLDVRHACRGNESVHPVHMVHPVPKRILFAGRARQSVLIRAICG